MKQEHEKNPLVSIIIPIYNTEAYLNACLESVTNQTYTNLEIICVDDGSTDHSVEIVKEWIRRDSRIMVIQQEHLGQVLQEIMVWRRHRRLFCLRR